MQRVKRVGFAGIPGVVLDKSDYAKLNRYFAEESGVTGPALSGFGGSGAACFSCDPKASVSDKVASRVFRELGASQLAEATVDGKQSELMEQAGVLANGMAGVLKFQTDKMAVLGKLTSPMFAQSVSRSIKKFHGLEDSERTLGALTFGYLIGAIDARVGKPSIYAQAYRQTRDGLAELVEKFASSEQKSRVQPALRAIGRESLSSALAGLGLTTTQRAEFATSQPSDYYGSDTFTSSGAAFALDKVYGKFQDQKQRFDSTRGPDAKTDVGTPTRSPLSLTTVDTYGALGLIWNAVVFPMQSTSPKWKGPRPFANRESALAFARISADRILDRKKKGENVSDAELIAAWIVKNYGPRIVNYDNAGIGDAEWSKYGGVPYTPILPKKPDYEGRSWTQVASNLITGDFLSAAGLNIGFQSFFANDGGTRWSGDVIFGAGRNQKNTGLWSYINIKLAPDSFVGVTSSEFGRQCMIAYYAGTEQTKAHLLEYLANPGTQFPVLVGYALALARRDALERTGQIGRFEGATWVPDVNGSELIPQGTEIYADWRAKAGPDQVDVRWEAVGFVSSVYRNFYKREPTRHAIGWYARMGYGLGTKWYDMAPNDVKAFTAAITRVRKTDLGNKTPEDTRLASADISEIDAKNRTNWFAILGRKLSSVMSVVIDAMVAGIEAVVNILCKVFKWMFGSSVGGVLCSLIGGILKFALGNIAGTTAALLAMVKALSEFIGHLTQREWMKAFTSLFLGINQVIFFTLGTPFAIMLGGPNGRVPLLKSQEAKERAKAQAAGLNPDDVVFPSLERMAERLTVENPFFVVGVISSVLTIVISTAGSGGAAAAAAVKRGVGELIMQLSVVVGIFLAPTVMKWIKESKDEFVSGFKALPKNKIEQAIAQLCKIVALVIMGVLQIAQAISMLKEKWALYVKRKGGTGAAVRSTIGFFFQKLGVEFTLMVGAFRPALKSGFSKDNPAMIVLTEAAKSFINKLPGVIIAFADEELGLAGEELEAFKDSLMMGFDNIQQARDAFQELKTILGPDTQVFEEVVPVTPPRVAETKKQEKKKEEESRSKKLLPVFGLAAGLALGFVLFGGSDGA